MHRALQSDVPQGGTTRSSEDHAKIAVVSTKQNIDNSDDLPGCNICTDLTLEASREVTKPNSVEALGHDASWVVPWIGFI
jgi:hypothetical protein